MTDYTVVRGVCPVIETPFADDGEVDIVSFDRLLDHLVSAGVRSVMYPGYASEFYKLTDTEREMLIGRVIDRFRGVPGAVVVISVPDHSTYVAVERARAAARAGAHMINILPPYLNGPSGDQVQAHIRAVVDAVAPTPVILQYAPAQTGTALDAPTISFLSEQSPNLVQVKVESTPPGSLISALRHQKPSLDTVVGYGGVQLIDALRRGAVGVQPGCSFVEIYLRMWDLWEAGAESEAVALHTRLLPYISYWMQGVELIVAAEKLISVRRGIIASSHCRAPARLLDAEEVALVDRFLAEFTDLL